MNETSNCSILQFKINQQLYGLPLSNIDRVIHYLEMQTVPGVADYYAGIMNIQGHNILVIDLAKKLNIDQSKPYTLDTPIVICQTDQNEKAGFIVDEVVGITDAQESDQQLQKILQQNSDACLLGDLHTDNGDTLLLNADKLVQASNNQKPIDTHS